MLGSKVYRLLMAKVYKVNGYAKDNKHGISDKDSDWIVEISDIKTHGAINCNWCC